MIEFRDLEVVQLMVMTLVVYDFGNRGLTWNRVCGGDVKKLVG